MESSEAELHWSRASTWLDETAWDSFVLVFFIYFLFLNSAVEKKKPPGLKRRLSVDSVQFEEAEKKGEGLSCGRGCCVFSLSCGVAICVHWCLFQRGGKKYFPDFFSAGEKMKAFRME